MNKESFWTAKEKLKFFFIREKSQNGLRLFPATFNYRNNGGWIRYRFYFLGLWLDLKIHSLVLNSKII
jgi:hypothetical protein